MKMIPMKTERAKSLLIVDDKAEVRHPLAERFLRKGLTVREVLLCELQDSGGAGRIVFAGSGSAAEAVRCRHALECEYIDLAGDGDMLLTALAAFDSRRADSRAAQKGERLVAVSASMRALQRRIRRAAGLDSTVLVTGETGTGKEVLAREIFRASVHRRGKFVPVNCGAIPEHLVETEFFGHRRGAFTNAVIDKIGLVEVADGGVLFLDEIGEMPLAMQSKLLRFLDSGEFRRVGDATLRRADVRVIAATNRRLQHEIAAGRFRADLFYRLNVVSVHVPPLRERREDIAPLALNHLERAALKLRATARAFSEGALAALQRHPWPGNVRELQNIVETAATLAAGETITEEEVRSVLLDEKFSAVPLPRTDAAKDQREIDELLRHCGGNRTRAAAILGVSRTTLWRRRRRLPASDSQ